MEIVRPKVGDLVQVDRSGYVRHEERALPTARGFVGIVVDTYGTWCGVRWCTPVPLTGVASTWSTDVPRASLTILSGA